jgi:hypothetical protein
MFASFLPISGGEKTFKLRRHMNSAGFSTRLLLIIESFEAPLSDDLIDPTIGMLTNVFRLIQNLRQDSHLGSGLAIVTAIGILVRDFINPPVMFLNAQWKAVRVCVVTENIFVVVTKMNVLLGLFQNHSERFCPFQTTILQIIAVVWKNKPEGTNFLANSKFLFFLCDIIRRFPLHGIFHQEITKFFFRSSEMAVISHEI